MKHIEVIKTIMFETGLSQENLANLLLINQTTVSQWLLGRKNPGYDNILRVCEVFLITPNQFFGLEELPDFKSIKLNKNK